ncbi:MAG: hypothetical protein SynsKO_21690 [Synoicihabitans sp.]
MKIDEIQWAMHEQLSQHFDGFKYRKSDFEYAKRVKGISHIFRIYLHAKTEWIKVEPAIFLGSSDVNKLFNNALGRKLPATGSTCGFSVRNKYKERGNYSIESESDITSVVECLRRDFTEIAIPLFEDNRTLQDVEKYINTKSEDGKYCPESVSDACLGISAAKLCENPDFGKICDDYYEFCRQAQSPVLAAPILKIRDYLVGVA